MAKPQKTLGELSRVGAPLEAGRMGHCMRPGPGSMRRPLLRAAHGCLLPPPIRPQAAPLGGGLRQLGQHMGACGGQKSHTRPLYHNGQVGP